MGSKFIIESMARNRIIKFRVMMTEAINDELTYLG